MADLLYDLLVSVPDPGAPPRTPTPAPVADQESLDYLATLASQPISALDSTEPQGLANESHRLLLSLQALSKKSHDPIIRAATHHAALPPALHGLAASTAELRTAIPRLDNEAVRFSTTFAIANAGENALLARRRRALLLSRNVERLVDVLELPTLLSSAISSVPANYSSALDLNGHIRRLQSLHPNSPLVAAVSAQAQDAMRTMAANLIKSLKAPGMKLAASLRTIGWLRRVLPDIETAAWAGNRDSREQVLGALFLVCRLAMLMDMLEALAPLRDLADQERSKLPNKSSGPSAPASVGAGAGGNGSGIGGNAWSVGQQTEKYLKKYIEIFREQSFAIVSMYRSVFPSDASPSTDKQQQEKSDNPTDPALDQDPLGPLPSPLATFPLHLVDMLLETLRLYLPTVKDQASRDSLLTQVLYCAGSLGRLGGDFGLFLATLDLGGEAKEEWIQVVERHRLLAGRLQSIVGEQKDKASK